MTNPLVATSLPTVLPLSILGSATRKQQSAGWKKVLMIAMAPLELSRSTRRLIRCMATRVSRRWFERSSPLSREHDEFLRRSEPAQRLHSRDHCRAIHEQRCSNIFHSHTERLEDGGLICTRRNLAGN